MAITDYAHRPKTDRHGSVPADRHQRFRWSACGVLPDRHGAFSV